MKSPLRLANAFGAPFEGWIGQFLIEQGLIPDLASLHSSRYLSRSIVPHITRLSQLFNRQSTGEADVTSPKPSKVEKRVAPDLTENEASGLAPYWKDSSNPEHLRLAYFLYFMPCNLYRMASIWAELARLGYQWPTTDSFRAVEFGAGPASGATGIAAGEKYSPLGLPREGSWALIEQDRSVLRLGDAWAQRYFSELEHTGWSTRPFHRKLNPETDGFLPSRAPQFHLWLMSFYLNEISMDAKDLASLLIREWKNHLEEEGLIILSEPALKSQSRRLLELRKAILEEIKQNQIDWLQILLPCLGHQACGALENPEDWCHEEVSWWRPPYFKKIDQMAGLDRKTLPMSYLVIAKSRRSRDELLPALKSQTSQATHRLVSPAHNEGKTLEFFLCGQEGKRRARYKPSDEDLKNQPPEEGNHETRRFLDRGDILLGSTLRGDKNSMRVDHFDKKI